MSTADALKAFQDAATGLKSAVAADKLALDNKVRDAKAALDSVTGEQSRHAAMTALADGIDLLTRGEAVVSGASATTIRAWVYGSAAAVLIGLGLAAKFWLHLF